MRSYSGHRMQFFGQYSHRLAPLLRSVQASQIARDSPFRDDEAELLQLAVDFGRSPVRVLVRQASDQLTYLLRDLRSATLAAGTPTPIETEAGAVPSDDRLRLHR
jgi:hypothetical protein